MRLLLAILLTFLLCAFYVLISGCGPNFYELEDNEACKGRVIFYDTTDGEYPSGRWCYLEVKP